MPTRDYSCSQTQMFGYEAKDRLPEGHICFLIDEVVEDLELGPAARGNTVLGAPVYDPRMMVKVLFYGYARGIRSSRKLADECRENIGFIHLCRGATADFRTICRFRSENEGLLQSAFSELIGRLVQSGVVRGSHIIADGTKIRANASNRKILPRKFFDEVRKAVDEWMSDSASQDKQEDLGERLSSAGIGRTGTSGEIDSLQRLVDKCSKVLEEGETCDAKVVSLTDPDSRFMKDGATGKLGLSYNVQAAVDAESGIIVACDVTDDAVDNNSLCRLVAKAEASSGETVDTVDADSGFFEMEQIRRLEDGGKDVCVADSETVSAMRKGRLREFIEGEKFIYDSQRDVFVCPYGNEHVGKPICRRKSGRVYRVYEATRACGGCPCRRECLGDSRSRFHKLERTADHPGLYRYRLRFLLAEYQDRLTRRRLIEHNFGHLKHNLGFRRFLLRGLSGARIETFLVACASVLRRICNILSRTGRNWGCLRRMQGVAEPTAA